MTTKTRRTLFLAVFVLALTLPAETILLQAIQSPTDSAAAERWVAGLDATSVQRAADDIQSYPFVYRKEIMRALPPAKRSAVWRDHIATYIRQHPELDAAAVTTMNAAIAAVTPNALSDKVTSAERNAVRAVGEQLQGMLGEDTAKYLLYYLGPRDMTFASAEPLTLKVASYLRNHFVTFAQSDNCDCQAWFGCDGNLWCEENIYCNADTAWPMCGFAWNWQCDAICRGY